MPDHFEEDLKKRLLDYSEEPRGDLWAGIAPHIGSIKPKPAWVKWIPMLALLMIGFIILWMHPLNNKKQLENKISKNNLRQERNDHEKEIINENETSESTDVVYKSHKQEQTKSGIAEVEGDKELMQEQNILNNNILMQEETTMNVLFQKENLITEYNKVSDFSAHSKSDSSSTMPSKISNIVETKMRRTETETSAKKSKHAFLNDLSLYLTAMPTFGYQRIEPNHYDNVIIESIKRVPAFSSDRLGLRVEIGAVRPFTTRMQAFVGFLYYQRKQTITYVEKYVDSLVIQPINEEGQISIEPQFSYLRKSLEYELKNIGLQFGFTYQLSKQKSNRLRIRDTHPSKETELAKKRFLHVIGSGIEFHKALNKISELEKAKGFTNPSAYVFYNFFYRAQYPDEGRLRAIFQPTFNYSFYINQNLNAPFYVKPYGLGLNFGCTYNF